MPDFSDNYFEELKKKIRLITEDHSKLSPNKEEEESVPETDKGGQVRHAVEKAECAPNQKESKSAIIFSLKNQVTGLVRALRVFQVKFSSLLHSAVTGQGECCPLSIVQMSTL